MNDCFEFEAEFVATLRCIPMTVRFKLDLCGVKLSLQAWGRFDHGTRERLATMAIRGPGELAEYQFILSSALDRIGEPLKGLVLESNPQWLGAEELPLVVDEQARNRGLIVTDRAKWKHLDALQRFALIKLTRPGHDNDNLGPALHEFGLVA